MSSKNYIAGVYRAYIKTVALKEECTNPLEVLIVNAPPAAKQPGEHLYLDYVWKRYINKPTDLRIIVAAL